MNSWILSVCATILLTVVVGLIVPQGKLGGFIKSIFSLVTIIVIIQPMVELKNVSYDFNFSSQLECVIQQNYLDFADFKKTQALESDAVTLLVDKGYKVNSVTINYDSCDFTYKIKKISVYFDKSVIKPDNVNIDIIDEITDLLMKYFNVDKGVVSVYER